MIVGKTLGANALAAVGSTSIIIYFVLCFYPGFTNGLGICLGQRFGAKDRDGMKKSIAASVVLCLGITVVITLVCCMFSWEILDMMKTPEDIRAQAYEYMFVVLLGTGATVFYNMISTFCVRLATAGRRFIFWCFLLF